MWEQHIHVYCWQFSLEPSIMGQGLLASFFHFSLFMLVSFLFLLPGLHGEAKDLVQSLVSVLLKAYVGSVPRAWPSFQEGLLLWKFGLPWD